MRNHLGTINGDTANHSPATYSLLLLSRITPVDLRRRVASKKEHEEDVEKITRDIAEAGSSEVEKPVEVQSFTGEKKAEAGSSEVEKPVEVQSFTGEKKFVENKKSIQPKQKISSQRNTSNNVEIQSTSMLAVAAKITETETCEDMNEVHRC
ncbi:hypothetical protein QE152_g24482 [Popillia japonica]|uniref:Uncharacterized protein n=1 Tax=Popillia japonica TaxID=7064 RepID=A0AAW1KBK2_POPJA